MLAASGVWVRYGDAAAVRGVDLSVRDGEALGLVGESGCGKTSLVRALLGLTPRGARCAGVVELAGERIDLAEPHAMRTHLGRRVGFVPQGAMSALNPVMRVGDQIAESLVFHLGYSWRSARAAAGNHLERVGIPRARCSAYPHEFSGGMRQRVVIALTLAAEPALVIADEPTVGLDAAIQREILALLGQLRAETGVSLLLVTHDLDSVRKACDRIGVMYAGRLIEEAPHESVTSEPNHPYTRALLHSAPGHGEVWRQIPGQAPDPRALPPGCAFAPRCEHSTDRCIAADPELMGDGHRTACHHVGAVPVTARPVEGLTPTSRPIREPARAATVVHCSGVRVTYGDVIALDGVDVEIRAGEIVGLLGPSGSGKSTLGHVLLGLVEPDAGDVRVAGQDVGSLHGRSLRRFRRDVIGLVQQDPYDALHPAMTVAAAVAEPLRWSRHRGDHEDRVATALVHAGLDPTSRLLHARPAALSGGQRQRVALARALVTRPEFLVADEPTSMLDVSIRAGIASQLVRLRDELGITILFVTHDIAESEQLCDRVIEMDCGRVVAERSSRRRTDVAR